MGWSAHSAITAKGGRSIFKLAVLDLCETLRLECFEVPEIRGRLIIPRRAVLNFAVQSAGHIGGHAMMMRTAFRLLALAAVAGGGGMLAATGPCGIKFRS